MKIANLILLLVLTGCANTDYKSFEAKNNLFEGRGGTKEIVDGMEIWDNGEPPRKFKILGVIDDHRSGGLIPMSQLKSDIVRKAREAGGDAVIELGSSTQLSGLYTSGSGSATAYGNSASAYGSSTTVPIFRNATKFAVIRWVE